MPDRWKGSVYSLHPGFAMEISSMANLKSRTGKPLEEWIKIINETGPEGDAEKRQWLKDVHGITTNYAMWLVERAAGRGSADDYDPEQMVEDMFAGPKSALRPIYDRLLDTGFALGEDVTVCPCATIVPFYRNHVFAQIKPSTRTRIDLGFALKGVETPERLIDTGGAAKGDRITHRIPITTVDEIDSEVEQWLITAYDRDSK